jgi:energy-converting hydrogenase Eha subunit F
MRPRPIYSLVNCILYRLLIFGILLSLAVTREQWAAQPFFHATKKRTDPANDFNHGVKSQDHDER